MLIMMITPMTDDDHLDIWIMIMDYDLQEEQCRDINGNQHWCQSDKVFFLHHFLTTDIHILEQKEPFKKNEML